MQPASPAAPTPRKSRLGYLVVSFVLLCIAAPFAYRTLVDWQREREVEAICRELDAEDPHWRWPDIVAHLPAPPPDDERNAAVQAEKVWELVKPQYPHAAARTPRFINARLQEEELQLCRDALKKVGVNAVTNP